MTTINQTATPDPEFRKEDDKGRIVVDVDGNEVEKIALGAEEFLEFNRLLIATFFSGNIRDGAPDEVRNQIFAEIEAVCLMRGIEQFTLDIEKAEGEMAKVLSQYSQRLISRIQKGANSLYATEKNGRRPINPGDRAVLDFCKRVGVRHMPDKPEGIGDLINQLAKALGVSDERMEELREAARSGKPTPGCDCDACEEKRRKLEANVEDPSPSPAS